MSEIHLIKNDPGLPSIVPVEGEPNTFSSGYWSLSEQSALSLLDGRIYFHERQNDPSFFGGRIVDAWVQPEGEYRGRIVFKFIFAEACKGVKTSRAGWAQEMKIVV